MKEISIPYPEELCQRALDLEKILIEDGLPVQKNGQSLLKAFILRLKAEYAPTPHEYEKNMTESCQIIDYLTRTTSCTDNWDNIKWASRLPPYDVD